MQISRFPLYDNLQNMKRSPLGTAAFSLVEVTLAFGVAAICLIASVFLSSGGRLPRRSDAKAGVGCDCRSRLNSHASGKNRQRCCATFTLLKQRDRGSASPRAVASREG